MATNDIVLGWERRDRRDNDGIGTLELNEFSERYEVDIFNGATVVRTITSTQPTITYTSAQQITDFGAAQTSIVAKIYQMSEVIGRGYPKNYNSGSLTNTPYTLPPVTPTASSQAANALQKANNLSDLASVATARTNLGLGTAALVNAPVSGNASNLQTVLGSDTRLFRLTTVKTANYTALDGDRIPCNTSAGVFIITLPTSGRVWIFDAFGNSPSTGFGTNNLTLTPASGTIMGASNLVLSVGATGLVIELIGTDWRITT